MRTYFIISASIVAAALIGFMIIFQFEPNDLPANRPLSVITGLLLLPVAPFGFAAEALENRFQIPGPWSGLLMLASVFISAVVWSLLIFLVRRKLINRRRA
ncbi:MAG: hypothetical protein HY301_06065 [Verrucomicrobia bacterium]|nr:hypothetical protein [Verrucomicrobiota bacterium]